MFGLFAIEHRSMSLTLKPTPGGPKYCAPVHVLVAIEAGLWCLCSSTTQ